jgi:hypothetical protein
MSRNDKHLAPDGSLQPGLGSDEEPDGNFYLDGAFAALKRKRDFWKLDRQRAAQASHHLHEQANQLRRVRLEYRASVNTMADACAELMLAGVPHATLQRALKRLDDLAVDVERPL